MVLDIKIKDIDLKSILFVDETLNEDRLEMFLNEVESYVKTTLLYGTIYDGILYKMYVSTCIKYLVYAKTDRAFTLRSIVDVSYLLNKNNVFEWSEFDCMIYRMECTDINHRSNILHEHSIFNMFFDRCYYKDEFTFCLLEVLLHTISKMVCVCETESEFEVKDKLHDDIDKLYETAISKDKHAFYIQCIQFLNRDKVRKL